VRVWQQTGVGHGKAEFARAAAWEPGAAIKRIRQLELPKK
jgi:hypothetical protein